MKKGLVFCFVCLLMLVTIPIGKSTEYQDNVKPTLNNDEIEYPKENGPYRFIFLGFYIPNAFEAIEIEEGKVVIGPIVYLKYPNYLIYKLPPLFNRLAIIDDDVYKKDTIDKWNTIETYGFRGIYSLGNTAFGICDEINIIWYE